MSVTVHDDIDQETWRPIPGFIGYEVSDLGRVRSYRKHGGTGRGLVGEPRMKKVRPNRVGYLTVTLQKPDGDRCSAYLVHSLVAAAFLGPRPAGTQVAHGDGDRGNARLENLRYATPSENADDKRRHGTDTPGERNGMSKLSEADVRAIRRLRAQGALQRELAEGFNVSISAIQFVLNGQHWSHVEEDVA